MKKAVLVLVAFVLTVLQITVTWRFGIGGRNYGLLLASVVILSVYDIKTACITSAICGIMVDCVQGNVLFLNLLVCFAAVLIVKLTSGAMNRRSLFAVVIFVFVISFFSEFIQYLIFFIIPGKGNISFALTKIIFPQVFINTGCAVILYGLYKLLWKALKIERERWQY